MRMSTNHFITNGFKNFIHRKFVKGFSDRNMNNNLKKKISKFFREMVRFSVLNCVNNFPGLFNQVGFQTFMCLRTVPWTTISGTKTIHNTNKIIKCFFVSMHVGERSGGNRSEMVILALTVKLIQRNLNSCIISVKDNYFFFIHDV